MAPPLELGHPPKGRRGLAEHEHIQLLLKAFQLKDVQDALLLTFMATQEEELLFLLHNPKRDGAYIKKPIFNPKLFSCLNVQHVPLSTLHKYDTRDIVYTSGLRQRLAAR